MRHTFLALAAAACLAGSAGPRAASTVLPFVENDYARAVADARTRGVPLFVEIWAPW